MTAAREVPWEVSPCIVLPRRHPPRGRDRQPSLGLKRRGRIRRSGVFATDICSRPTGGSHGRRSASRLSRLGRPQKLAESCPAAVPYGQHFRCRHRPCGSADTTRIRRRKRPGSEKLQRSQDVTPRGHVNQPFRSICPPEWGRYPASVCSEPYKPGRTW